MRSGTYKFTSTDLAIGGEADTGIDLTRNFEGGAGNDGYVFKQNFGKFFSHNWIIRLSENRIQVIGNNSPAEYDFMMTVQYGSLGTTFRSVDSPINYVQVSNDSRATLTMTGTPNSASTYTFTASDGTIVLFRPFKALGSGTDCTDGTTYRCVYASKITKPDGTVYDLEYDTTNASGWDTTRLRSVTSNRGFALVLEYNSPSAGYNLISKACVLNTARTAKPSTNICPTGVMTATYAYSGTVLTSATDASGGVHGFSATLTNPGTFTITNPGAAVPFVTNSYSYDPLKPGAFIITAQAFADGSSYNYTYQSFDTSFGDNQVISELAGGSFTDGNGQTVTLQYNAYLGPLTSDPTKYITPGPETITDQLGRVTSANYCISPPVNGRCGLTQLRTITDPEGKKRAFTYDSYRNVVQIVTTPKPASGDPVLTTTSAFGCFPATACNKPTSVTDARGNVANFTYSGVHGGMLTKVSPAAGGVSPAVKYAHGQYYAWLKASGGGYVQAATPVWLKSEERSCRSSALNLTAGTCAAGAADLVVTSYQYEQGNASKGSNLLLLGVAVTADGQTLRTCYSYDAMGRKISETQPNANLASCP